MTCHTLHVGTNYTGTLSRLAGCVNDAHDVHALCRKYSDSSTKLTATKYDREGMITAFRKARQRLQNPGDLLFVSISGHGARERHKNRWVEAIVCDDLELIYDYEFRAECLDRPAGTFIIGLFDFCHSELHRGIIRGAKRSIPINQCRHHKHRADTKPRALPNCGFIAGCEVNGYSYDGIFNGRPNGALTYYTLQALRELPSGATFNRLFHKVGGRGGYLPSEEYPQQPTRMGSAKNFARAIPFL